MTNTNVDGLNESQRAAVTHTGSHALVLAGAGSGKTRTIIARAGHLISSGVPADRIQILTFTRRSAREIIERVKMNLGDKANNLNASTFHTWCMSLIRRMPNFFGCSGHSIIDRDDQIQLFKVLRGREKGGPLPTAARLCDIYSYARNTRTSLTKSLERTDKSALPYKDKIAGIARAYEAKKRERHYLDYDDILDIVATVLQQDAKVRYVVNQQYDHLLVDEMQDTNPLQWDLLDALRDKVQLFCVGDDAQSIYGFRGADFRNVHSFTKRVPNSTTLRLEQNYRSTQEILDLSNWLLAQSPLEYNKRLIAVRGSGHIPKLLNFTSEWGEGRWIAEDIAKRREDGSEWKRHLILVRSGYAGRAVETALLARDIPYKFIGGTKLLESAHVKDVLSILRLVANPFDEIAWMRYLTLWPHVGEVTASDAMDKILKSGGMDECLQILSNENKLPEECKSAVAKVAALSGNPAAAFSTAINMLGDVLAHIYRNREWDKRKRDFHLVERLAKRHDSILGFIEEYLLDPVYGSRIEEVDEDAVILITIHSAKGMEKPICYVVNVSPGSFPSPHSIGSFDDIEEERRVLYVALTRAQDELIITRNSHAFWANQTDQQPFEGKALETYFLNDLPSELVNEEEPEGSMRQLGIDSAVVRERPAVGIDLS